MLILYCSGIFREIHYFMRSIISQKCLAGILYFTFFVNDKISPYKVPNLPYDAKIRLIYVKQAFFSNGKFIILYGIWYFTFFVFLHSLFISLLGFFVWCEGIFVCKYTNIFVTWTAIFCVLVNTLHKLRSDVVDFFKKVCDFFKSLRFF